MKKVRVTKQRMQKFLENNTVIGESLIPEDDSKIYYSKVDGSYMGIVGNEGDLKYLIRLGISEQIQNTKNKKECTANIGFNPEEQKWYGWSHRAIYGFGIGSKCKKGNCGYRASNKKEYAERCLDFWVDDLSHSVGDEKWQFGEGLDFDGENTVKGVWISYTYDDKAPNKKLRGTEFTHFAPFPNEFGKGEWEAKTIDEAKQMAIDFAEGVG